MSNYALLPSTPPSTFSSPILGSNSPSVASTTRRRNFWGRNSRPILMALTLLSLAAIIRLTTPNEQQQEIKAKVDGYLNGGAGLVGSAKDWWASPTEGGGAKDGDGTLEGTKDEDWVGEHRPLEPEGVRLDSAVEPPSDELTPQDSETPTEHPPVECTEALREELNSPSFWVARRTSALHYEISPSDPSVFSFSNCLDHAIFSARLVSEAESSTSATTESKTPTIISALVPPTLTKTSGVYSLKISPNHLIPFGRYRLEVRLAFGSLPGAQLGSVCGEEKLTCTAAGLPAGERFIGEKIEVASEYEVTIGQGPYFVDTASPCESLSPLAGFWDSEKFYPSSPSGIPCRLQTPTFPTPFTSPAPIWINIVGDSNPRNLFSALEKSFGTGRKTNFFTMESKVKNGTVATIALRSFSGDLDPSASPDILISWQWWHAKAHNLEANAAELARWTNGTLSEYLSRANLKGAVKGLKDFQTTASTLRPRRTYISLGSHSEDLTARGIDGLLDVLFSEQYVSEELRKAANVRVFTTTLVHSANIPLDRFPRQDLTRNNAVIHAKNDVIRNRPELQGRVIDVEGVTAGITESFMKSSRDAVHFTAPIYYNAWTSLVWTDLMINGP
ncbi:hypothetical protein P7C70_g7433, partial [Phenoliferia sp. Uapishka_3]